MTKDVNKFICESDEIELKISKSKQFDNVFDVYFSITNKNENKCISGISEYSELPTELHTFLKPLIHNYF